MNTRRSFLRSFGFGVAATGAIIALPGPLKAVGRVLVPRWMPTILRVSTPSLRATWPAIAAATARAATARAWLIAAGGAAGVVLKKFKRTGGLPFWFDPIFRPSLRSLTDGSVR